MPVVMCDVCCGVQSVQCAVYTDLPRLGRGLACQPCHDSLSPGVGSEAGQRALGGGRGPISLPWPGVEAVCSRGWCRDQRPVLGLAWRSPDTSGARHHHTAAHFWHHWPLARDISDNIETSEAGGHGETLPQLQL